MMSWFIEHEGEHYILCDDGPMKWASNDPEEESVVKTDEIKQYKVNGKIMAIQKDDLIYKLLSRGTVLYGKLIDGQRGIKPTTNLRENNNKQR